ncbi:ATP-grasp domain-containing protein [Brochothrix thermosphacta]|uniref:ATP-grasp fold RimK-type domain-containing protein n=1 Tax=Brochothrix thermosphacta TaxID=2756 RepID=A0A1D2LX27_BROTH|nr:hypothetical protein [Brochothrix thermosphacta]ATF26391.1 hypothetical protein CNY62_08370 [Brochothrix thermosphacta]ATH85731.1 hypothetical protein CPF12_07965 [Brochothrix thermosphacta]MPQ28778.1 hypothetical protein [Brochothrix thermosphacta]ODJ68351.1 hypothetical protein BFR36_00730 [Brochothrix thermosphacta]ODJ74113.1 hypothetical protein BFR45_01480 [Brochothrix thermosphacta]
MKNKPLLLNQIIGKRNLADNKKDLDFKNNILTIFKSRLETATFKRRLLILTSLDDAEINIIGPHLIKNKIDYLRLNCENFSDLFEFSIKIPNDSKKSETQFTYFNKTYTLNDFDYIWVRHFNDDNFFQFSDFDYILHKYLLVEWSELFYAICEIHPEKIVTPIQKKITKPLQLLEAKKMGFSIPRTIITNSATDLDHFFYGLKTKIFAKSLKHHSIYASDGSLLDFYGRTFDSLETLKKENIKAAPVIYQEQLPKDRSTEYRINIFGESISSFRYENVKNHDWHLEDITGIEMSEKKLPLDIQQKLLSLFEKLNLKIGTVDLIHCNHKWYFLEINLAGDWRWLEQAANTDLSQDISSFFNS